MSDDPLPTTPAPSVTAALAEAVAAQAPPSAPADLEAGDGWPPEAVAAALAPMLSDERRARIEAVLDHRTRDVTVVLEEVSDPHNAAAALRSCEAFGLCEMHVVEGTGPVPAGPRLHKGVLLPPARFRPAHKVAQGCERWIDVPLSRDVAECLAALKRRGYLCLAARPDAPKTLGELDLCGRKVALVLGNEHRGLSEKAVAACDGAYRLPMVGMVESLNLSVSVALSVYHAVVVAGLRRPLDPLDRARLRARWYLDDVPGARAVVRRHLEKA